MALNAGACFPPCGLRDITDLQTYSEIASDARKSFLSGLRSIQNAFA